MMQLLATAKAGKKKHNTVVSSGKLGGRDSQYVLVRRVRSLDEHPRPLGGINSYSAK